jgi:hypothetical protein
MAKKKLTKAAEKRVRELDVIRAANDLVGDGWDACHAGALSAFCSRKFIAALEAACTRLRNVTSTTR